MAEWYVCLLKDAITPYSDDEAVLRAYMEDVYKVENPVIYKVDDEKLRRINEEYCADRVLQQWGDLYFTDTEAEMVSQSLEEDTMEICNAIKLLNKELKYYDTPAAKKLKKALKEFKDERVKSENMEIDEYDFQGRLFEKVNLYKYTKRIFKNYRKNYFSGKNKRKDD